MLPLGHLVEFKIIYTLVNLSKLWETVEDRGAWRAAVRGVTKSWAKLRD